MQLQKSGTGRNSVWALNLLRRDDKEDAMSVNEAAPGGGLWNDPTKTARQLHEN